MRRPDHTAQYFAPVLTVCASLNGYKLAYVGGAHFERVREYRTADEAYAALKIARDAVAKLNSIGAA